MFASGNVTIDTFDIDGFQVKNQPFLEAITVKQNGISWDDPSIIHGIIGLAPSIATSVLNNPSLLMTMFKENVLNQNLFSMRRREPRELMVDAVNHNLFTGDLVRIPRTNKTGRYALTGSWQAEASYLTLGSDPGIRMSLAGYTASFSPGVPFICLPERLIMGLLEDLQFEEIMFMPPSVSCEQRGIMPDITLNLAGENSTLTPYDYTFV
jgi:hypothetical protein